MQLFMSPKTKSNKGIEITTDSNRGYANIDIAFNEVEKIDMTKAVTYCCSNCLKETVKKSL